MIAGLSSAVRAGVASLVVLLGASAYAEGPVYDLTSFEETAPELVHAYDTLSADVANEPALWSALRGLGRVKGQGGIAGATATWLEARLALALGDDARADAALAALTRVSHGAFRDDALALVAERTKDKAAAAEALMARHPGAPAFKDGVARAVGSLSPAAALEALEALARRSLKGRDRAAIMLLLAEQQVRAGDKAAAVASLRRLWWRGLRRDAAEAAIEARLEKLGAEVPFWEATVRDVLLGHDSPSAKDLRTVFTRSRLGARGAAGRLAKRVKAFAQIMSAAWEGKVPLDRSLRKLDAYKGSLGKDRAFAPCFHYARAELLEADDRFDDAIAAWKIVYDRYPDHPLALYAMERASVYLRDGGRLTDARVLDARIALIADHGALQRDALWRTAFAAFLAGEHDDAERRFEALEQGYGGDRASTRVAWLPRLRYWRARNAAADGRRADARAHYQLVARRFPGTWYARLAVARLGDAAPPSVESDAVVENPALDTVVALLRLGAYDEARERLRDMARAGYVPGTGRRLFALLDPGTDEDDEPEAGVVAKRFEDVRSELLAAAEEFGVDPALLAAIAMVETRFNATARSRVGAMGMCQLMPDTGRALGRSLYGSKFSTRQLFDPEVNLRVAGLFITKLRERVGAHPAVLVAAYNAGGGRALRWLAESRHDETDVWVELLPASQARHYVQSVMTVAEEFRVKLGLTDAPEAIPAKVRP